MLNVKKCYTWFSNEFILKKSTLGWYSFKCPICNELVDRNKMAVNFNFGVVKCFVCSYKSRIIDFVMTYLTVDYVKAKDILNNCIESAIELENLKGLEAKVVSSVSLPTGYNSILDGDGILGQRARAYLSDRGFDLNELDKKGIGYCNESDMDKDSDFLGYIIIPFIEKGKLRYYIGRDFVGNFLRYKNPPKDKFGVGKGDVLFNADAMRIYSEVYVAEGWADACEMGRVGISTQGWSLSKDQKDDMLKSDCESFVFIPDVGTDNTGRTFYSKAVELAIDFIEHKEVHVLDLSVYSDLGKDANEIKKENILKLRKQSKPLTLEYAAELLMQ